MPACARALLPLHVADPPLPGHRLPPRAAHAVGAGEDPPRACALEEAGRVDVRARARRDDHRARRRRRGALLPARARPVRGRLGHAFRRRGRRRHRRGRLRRRSATATRACCPSAGCAATGGSSTRGDDPPRARGAAAPSASATRHGRGARIEAPRGRVDLDLVGIPSDASTVSGSRAWGPAVLEASPARRQPQDHGNDHNDGRRGRPGRSPGLQRRAQKGAGPSRGPQCTAGAVEFRRARREGAGPFPRRVLPGGSRARAHRRDRAGETRAARRRAGAEPRGDRRLSAHPRRRLGARAADMQDPCSPSSPTTPGCAGQRRLPARSRAPLSRRGPTTARRRRCGCCATAAESGSDRAPIGGESAGGHLSAVTLLRLRDRRGYGAFRAANLVYGAYDLSMTPSQRASGERHLILPTPTCSSSTASCRGSTWRHGGIRTYRRYTPTAGMPPALFTVGTRTRCSTTPCSCMRAGARRARRGDLACRPRRSAASTSCRWGRRAPAARAVQYAFLREAVGAG